MDSNNNYNDKDKGEVVRPALFERIEKKNERTFKFCGWHSELIIIIIKKRMANQQSQSRLIKIQFLLSMSYTNL